MVITIEYHVIASGSSGNAVVINEEILIDIGVPMKKLRESRYIKNLKLVLLTHQHMDHFNSTTVRTLHKERPTLRWVCCEWMVPHLLEAGVGKLSIDVTRPTEPAETSQALIYKNFAIVSPVHLIHDVPNCGWIILKNHEKIFYATDTSTLDHLELKGFDYYLIESNHKISEIKNRIAEKQARGEFAYEVRAAQNHLSEEQAMDWLAKNAGPNSQYVFLHQHE